MLEKTSVVLSIRPWLSILPWLRPSCNVWSQGGQKGKILRKEPVSNHWSTSPYHRPPATKQDPNDKHLWTGVKVRLIPPIYLENIPFTYYCCRFYGWRSMCAKLGRNWGSYCNVDRVGCEQWYIFVKVYPLSCHSQSAVTHSFAPMMSICSSG